MQIFTKMILTDINIAFSGSFMEEKWKSIHMSIQNENLKSEYETLIKQKYFNKRSNLVSLWEVAVF